MRRKSPQYVNGTALLVLDGADTGAFCYVTPKSNGLSDGLYGGTTTPGQWGQASIADSFHVSAGDVLQLVCYSWQNDANTYAFNSSLTATLINSGFDAKKGKHPHHVSSDPRAPKL
jgi:hypothetical protein